MKALARKLDLGASAFLGFRPICFEPFVQCLFGDADQALHRVRKGCEIGCFFERKFAIHKCKPYPVSVVLPTSAQISFYLTRFGVAVLELGAWHFACHSYGRK